MMTLLILSSSISLINCGGTTGGSSVIIYHIGTDEYGIEKCVQSTNGKLSDPFDCPSK